MDQFNSAFYVNGNNSILVGGDDILDPRSFGSNLVLFHNYADHPFGLDQPPKASGTLVGTSGNLACDITNIGLTSSTSNSTTAPILRTRHIEMNGVGGTNKSMTSLSYASILNNATSVSYMGLIKLDQPTASLIHSIRIVNSVIINPPSRFCPGFAGYALRIQTLNTEGNTAFDWQPTYTMPAIGTWFVYFVECNYSGRVLRASIDNKTEVSTTPSWTAGAVGNFSSSTSNSLVTSGGNGAISNWSIKAQFLIKNNILSSEQKRKLYNYMKTLL